MKKIILIIMVALTSNNMFAQYFSVDTAKLNNAYRNLMETPNDAKVQKVYFDAFPATWKDYDMTYQFLPNDNYDLTMYSLADKQVRAFGDLTSIPDDIYCKKLVNLAVGARLEADAPNYLKGLLWEKMKTKMDCIFTALSHLRKGHRMEFWEFYWSNIVESKDIPEEFNRLKKLNQEKHPEEVEIMSDAFKYFYNGVNFESTGYLK